MATVTISLSDLHFIYRQLNYLRNYLGVYSSDPMEHVIVVNLAPEDPKEEVHEEREADKADKGDTADTADTADRADGVEEEDTADDVEEMDTADDVEEMDTAGKESPTPVPDSPLITNFYGRLMKQMSYVLPSSPSKNSDD